MRFLITIVTVLFIAKAPDGSFARFQRDLGNLIARRPLECAARLDHPGTSPLARKLAEFVSGAQPELRYEKHLDDIFEDTLHPHY